MTAPHARRVLLLAGTTEATALAGRLVGAGFDVVSSFAGVTSAPAARPGRVRRGGFGGTTGLVDHLRREQVDALVDATHPFAAVMPFHAADAGRAAGVAHLRLVRPAWSEPPGAGWVRTADVPAAARVLAGLGAERVFLTIGRQQLGAFAGCPQWFLVRSIEPLDGWATGAPVARPQRIEQLLERGPFDVAGELAVLRDHRIDVLVAKDAGGTATRAKLDAAHELGVRVVMVDRPPAPEGIEVAATVEEALRWVGSRIGD